LVAGTPRLLTALGPVIVQHVDRLNLRGLHLQLASVGLDRRLAWLAENVRDAVTEEAATAPPPLWLKRYRRALVVIDAYLGVVASPAASDVVPDILDADIRSKRSLDDVAAASSDVSKRWGVVTSLQPHDFVAALRSARASD